MRTLAYLIPIVLILFTLNSCSTTESDAVLKLKAANAELVGEIESRDRSVENLLVGLEAVQLDMRDISIREGLLKGMTVSEAELARSPQQQIMEDIGLVDGLIRKNRNRIEELELLVKRSDGKLYEFDRIVANLKIELLDKEKDLNLFKENLAAMEENYATLLDDYQAQTILASMQDEALHRAYFAYGSKREMLEGKVMQKSGGVVGIGKTWELRPDFNKGYFTEVDIRTVDRIPLAAKKVDFLSKHPDDTYELIVEDKIVKELRITDPNRFWAGSRYLALMVE